MIYEESKFRDQTSRAGARGLMQITPRTADFIARRSGGTRFEQDDLAMPQINIAYGTYYLRYLIDRYDGDDEIAVAAYNAGETNVDRWIRVRRPGTSTWTTTSRSPRPVTTSAASSSGASSTARSTRTTWASLCRLRKPSAPWTTAPAWLTRSASQRSDVTT